MAKNVRVIGAERVIAALRNFGNMWYDHREDIPYEIKTRVIHAIVAYGSIDTGAFIRAVDYHKVKITRVNMQYRIDAFTRNPKVTYDGFLEVNHFNVPSSRILKERPHYLMGIEESQIERISDHYAQSSFRT